MDKFYGGGCLAKPSPQVGDMSDAKPTADCRYSRGSALPASTYAAAYAMEQQADHPSAEDVREAFDFRYGE